jgi:DNA-directed RNA polymerase
MGITDWLDGSGAGVGKKVKPYFRLLTPELTATVIARSVLDGISRNRKRTALAGAIGRAIQMEYQLQNFKQEHGDLFRTMVIENKHENSRMKEQIILKETRRLGIINKWWVRGDLISIGMTALMLMEKHTGMIMLYHKIMNGKRIGLIAPTSEMEEWLEESYLQDGLRGLLYEPMIEPPVDWVDNYTGGYKLHEFQTKGFINSKEGNHYDDLTYDDCPAVFDAVNTLQATAWRVNTKVLDVMTQLWREKATIAGLPNCDFLQEPEYIPDQSKHKNRRHFRETQRVRATNNYNVGRRFRFNNSMKTAQKFSEESAIYFPHHLDFRGRAYPIPKVFNPQGDDIAKGLLTFSEGKSFEGDSTKWFLIHGANMWGIKGSLGHRIEKILAMQVVLLRNATSPLDHTHWADADKPFQFLAWCFEFAEWRKNPNFLSRIPIAMDGSNNGLQLMSLILRDEEIGNATNCTPKDVPADIYQDVANEVTRRLKADPNKLNLALLRYGIDRSLMKKVVMSVPYGASYYTMISLFQETIYARFIEGEELQFHGRLRKPCTALASITWEVINDLMPRALELMAWVKDKVRPAIKANNEVSWVTPIGLKVYQGYRQTVRRRVVTAIGSKIRKEAYYRDPLDKLSMRNNLKAIVPNYIHSLDGSIMLSTTNLMKSKGINSLAMVHDSFATHVCDAPALARGLREVVIDTFQNNLQISFDKDIRQSYPDTYNERLPFLSTGTLDINQLTKSLYFFH